MHRAHAGRPDEVADRVGGQPRAGQHRARCTLGAPHHPRDRRGRVEHRRMAARGQHRRDGRHAQQRVECGVEVARDVERAMERERAAVGGGGDARERVEIDGAARVERAEHDAVRAGRNRRAHVALDHPEIVGVVDERPAVRPHDHVDGNRHRGDDGLDQADARRQPALADRGDEFETVGARAGGDLRIADGRGDHFEQDGRGSGSDHRRLANRYDDSCILAERRDRRQFTGHVARQRVRGRPLRNHASRNSPRGAQRPTPRRLRHPPSRDPRTARAARRPRGSRPTASRTAAPR